MKFDSKKDSNLFKSFTVTPRKCFACKKTIWLENIWIFNFSMYTQTYCTECAHSPEEVKKLSRKRIQGIFKPMK